MAPAENPAFWPLTLIVFLPALVAAGLSLPIIPKAREEIIRWSTLATTAVVFLLSLWVGAWPICYRTGGNAGGRETAVDRIFRYRISARD